MESSQMLGFWVTRDQDSLISWIARASARYTALEQALAPLQKVVRDLEPNWSPRAQTYWWRTMEYLPPLRLALGACCSLFERGQSSQQCPIPIGMLGPHMRYHSSLSSVEHEFEEAGIQLTSHSAATYSHEVGYIRQRQEVLEALRKLCETGQQAIAEGRAGLDELPAAQEAFLETSHAGPRKRRRGGVVSLSRKEGERD
jgi:hypothetical protein